MVRHYNLLILCGLWFVLRSEATLYLDDLCGQSITSHGDRLYSQYSKYYDNNMDCSLLIKAPYSFQRVTLDFAWIDTDNYLGNCRDYISIYDSNGAQIRKYCGAGEPADIFAIGNNITIRMVTDSSRVDNGFNLVFTSYHYDYEKSCNSSYEYRCINSRCVDDSLVCDGRNNCNDGTDEDNCSNDTVWIVIGVIFGVIFLGAIGISIWYCIDSKKKKKRAVQNSRDVVVTTNDAPPAYSGNNTHMYDEPIAMTTYPAGYPPQPPPYSAQPPMQ